MVSLMQAQTITVHNKSGVLLSDVIFTTREGNEVMVSFYGKKTITIPDEAIRFRIVSPAAYRNASTQAHDAQIATQNIPLMTFDDLIVRVTMDGQRSHAETAELHVQEL